MQKKFAGKKIMPIFALRKGKQNNPSRNQTILTILIYFIMNAINFNWTISKMVEGKAYNFNAFLYAIDMEVECSIVRISEHLCEVRCAGEVKQVRAPREASKSRVKDVLAMAILHGATLTSGQVYKCNLHYLMDENRETREIYAHFGPHGYAASTHFEENLPHDMEEITLGFELEMLPRSGCTEALGTFRSNVWRVVSDGSVRLGSEYVSTILNASDCLKPAYFEDFCDMLQGIATSRSNSETGLHAHTGRRAWGETEEEQNENIAKGIWFYDNILDPSALEMVFGRKSERWAQRTPLTGCEEIPALLQKYGKSLIKAEEIKKALKASLLKDNKIRQRHTDYPTERYRAINITNKATVEFRQGKGSISAKALARISQFIFCFIKYVRATKWEKLSQEGFIKSIPTSAKFDLVRACFVGAQDER